MLNCVSHNFQIFIDELLVHRQLRRHLAVTDNASSTTNKFFAYSGYDVDFNVIQQFVSAHFLLSVHNERTCNNFINSLVWLKEVNAEHFSELGLDSALILLNTDAMFSLPNIIQAHIILLASKCIGIQNPRKNKRCDELSLDFSFRAFEVSMNLYSRYLSTLDFLGDSTGSKNQSNCCKKSSCDSPEKLHRWINQLASFCRSHFHDWSSRNEENILGSSFAYIDESQHIIFEHFRQDTCVILKCMMSSFLSWEDRGNRINKKEDEVLENSICLAAALKLMGSSLLQILCMQVKCLEGKTLRDSILSKDNNLISRIIGCFGTGEANQVVQKSLLNVIGKDPFKHKELKQMFVHFASLLVYSFGVRLEFLWKGSIFMMMMVMNLIILEEDTLDVFKSFLNNSKEIMCSPIPLIEPLKVLLPNYHIVRSINFLPFFFCC